MNLFFKTSLLVFLALSGRWVYGQTTYFTDTLKSIVRIGVQGQMSYVSFAEPLRQKCLYDIVYIAPDRKAMYTQLLAAKLAGKRLSRLDYSQPSGSGTVCHAELVEISD